MMEWMEYDGKKVFLRCRDGRIYSGKVVNVSENPVLISIMDKYNKLVTIAISDISLIQEENTK